MEVRPRKIVYYQTILNRKPFLEWLTGYKGQKIYGMIQIRLRRVEQGNLGLTENAGEGVVELKIDFGPGYRIYIGQDGDTIVLLLGGYKDTQPGDIETAKKYWRDYRARTGR